MGRHRERHRRRSIRLKDYDYAQDGAYFVTVCTDEKRCIFGDIVDGQMRLNSLGCIVRDEWLKTANLRKYVTLDEFIVMPNHMHGIIFIACRGVLQYAPTTRIEFRSPAQTIGAIVRGFKSAVTKRINELRGSPGVPIWQRNYYEHVIRNDDDLNEIRYYISDNPLKWHLDKENPNTLRTNL